MHQGEKIMGTADWGVVEDWGLNPYESAYARQKEVLEERIAGLREDTLILNEHPPVFTIGSRKDSSNNIHLPINDLQKEGIEVSSTNRGGDVTYHGPGQLVVYPIISLKEKKDLEVYLRSLEQVIINTLGCLGLAASRRPGKTGIWLQTRKIAAIGVAVKKWVTYHGFALNVNTDLKPFNYITPCGIDIKEGTVTSMKAELGESVDMEEVKDVLKVEFWKIFPRRGLSL